MKCMFGHKLVIPKYYPSCHSDLTFKGNIFSFIKLLTIFLCIFHVTFKFLNSKIYKLKYPNTIHAIW